MKRKIQLKSKPYLHKTEKRNKNQSQKHKKDPKKYSIIMFEENGIRMLLLTVQISLER
jgi:hypothetical protein